MFTSLRIQNLRSIVDSGELALAPVTVIVGRNNSGKSSLLRAVYQVQEGAPWAPSDVRLGAAETAINLTFDILPGTVFPTRASASQWAGGTINLVRSGHTPAKASVTHPGQPNNSLNFTLFPGSEPGNFIYPALSGRRTYLPSEEQVRHDATMLIGPTDQNLVSRASIVMQPRTPEGAEFATLCERVLGSTLDIMTAQNGQRLGIAVSKHSSIGLDAMGMGFSGVLSLLINLAGATGKVFLLEEPENDLHPQALKNLLDVIVEKSSDNQFLISTHSSIVLTRLGSSPNATVIHTLLDRADNSLPTTTVHTVEGRLGRIDVMRDLGYALADLEIGEGWLIFEEASAEFICRQYLIPWFVPSLGRLTTVAAAGASRVGPLLNNLHEMTLFAHLQPAYKYRLWVIADGDAAGLRAIGDLQHRFKDWPERRFANWTRPNFEEYYPSIFDSSVAAVLSKPHDARREPKSQLLNDVLAWIADDVDRAKNAFERSAADVIQILRQVEADMLAVE